MDLKKVLYDIACAIVDHPESVHIEEEEQDNVVTFVLSVAEEDTGMVIGRHGKIAKAIRSIMKAASSGTGKKVIVEIK
ncbi:MAG: KH domain-containing protein [Clostridia bacterium]|nr:KH domain-containing protein [Clostridia bacterium]